ncbi:MAG: hypothetical protein PHG41_07285 [Actinomycetota bacterium]|nr:hypothetical protein [Actinomycetota bacterium]
MTSITDHPSYYRPIFLFNVTGIIFTVWSASGKGDMFFLAISDELIIDKLTVIIRVKA